MNDKKQKWILTHDSHELKKGDVYEGTTLPAWLNGKASPVSADVFEVATPGGAELEKLKAELTAETQRADAAEKELSAAQQAHAEALEAEKKRADAAEKELSAAQQAHAEALEAEKKRADAAEAALRKGK